MPNGRKTLFWKENWTWKRTLKETFPDLFFICMHQSDTSILQLKMEYSFQGITVWLGRGKGGNFYWDNYWSWYH